MRAISRRSYAFRALALPALLLMASGARAEPNAFGARGQRVPFGGVGVELELGAGAPRTGDALAHDFSVQASPGFMYFFTRNLAWGVNLDFRYGDYELRPWPFTDLEFGVSGGFGVFLPLNEVAGFFPRLWLGGGYMRREYLAIAGVPGVFFDPTFEPSARKYDRTFDGPYLGAGLLLPITFQVGLATFVSLGPSARLHLALNEGERSFELGLSAGVGRYF